MRARLVLNVWFERDMFWRVPVCGGDTMVDWVGVSLGRTVAGVNGE